MTYGSCHVTTAGLNSCDRDCVAHRLLNICYLALYRESLPALELPTSLSWVDKRYGMAVLPELKSGVAKAQLSSFWSVGAIKGPWSPKKHRLSETQDLGSGRTSDGKAAWQLYKPSEKEGRQEAWTRPCPKTAGGPQGRSGSPRVSAALSFPPTLES